MDLKHKICELIYSNDKFTRIKGWELDQQNGGHIRNELEKKYSALLSVLNIDVKSLFEQTKIDITQYEFTDRDTQNNTLIIDGLPNLDYIKILGCKIHSIIITNCNRLNELCIRQCTVSTFHIDKTPNLNNFIFTCNNIGKLSLRQLKHLTKINVSENRLNWLDIGDNKNLTHLNISANEITEIDVSKYKMLEQFDCSDNLLETLDVSSLKQLRSLSCDNNQLYELTLGMLPRLVILECNNNELNQLDISKCEYLEFINCSNNQIDAVLSYRHDRLEFLNISNNPICEFDFDKFPLYCPIEYDMNGTDISLIDMFNACIHNEIDPLDLIHRSQYDFYNNIYANYGVDIGKLKKVINNGKFTLASQILKSYKNDKLHT